MKFSYFSGCFAFDLAMGARANPSQLVSCKLCSESLAQNGLDRHMKSAHQNVPKQPPKTKCDICDKKIAVKYFDQHVKKHKTKCNICNEEIALKNVDQHFKSHNVPPAPEVNAQDLPFQNFSTETKTASKDDPKKIKNSNRRKASKVGIVNTVPSDPHPSGLVKSSLAKAKLDANDGVDVTAVPKAGIENTVADEPHAGVANDNVVQPPTAEELKTMEDIPWNRYYFGRIEKLEKVKVDDMGGAINLALMRRYYLDELEAYTDGILEKVKVTLMWWYDYVKWLEGGKPPPEVDFNVKGKNWIALPRKFVDQAIVYFKSKTIDHMQDISEEDTIEFPCRLKIKEYGKKPYICGKVFKSEYALNEHMVLHENHFKCTKCSGTFATKFLLNRHMDRGIHTKKSNCEHCQTLYTTVNMARHQGSKLCHQLAPNAIRFINKPGTHKKWPKLKEDFGE